MIVNPKHPLFTKLIVYILCLSLLIVSAVLPPREAKASTTRDRVQVVGNKVLTDIGDPLRGGPITLSARAYCDPGDPGSDQCGTNWGLNPDNWVRMSKMGINTGRIVLFDMYNRTQNRPPHWTVQELLPYLDIVVDNAEAAGMYAVINFHDVGNFNPTVLEEFWTAAAPRYKDRTHVIYEMVNEPVHGTLNTTQINNLADTYEIIRNAAPDTHVIHLSVYSMANDLVPIVNQYKNRINNQTTATLNFNNGKDSIGFHAYGTTTTQWITKLRNNFPVINTEIGYRPDQIAVNKINGTFYHIGVMEDLGISWFDWKAGRKDADFVDKYQRKILMVARNNNYDWAGDFFNGGFRQDFNNQVIDDAPANWTVSGDVRIRPNPSTTNKSVMLRDQESISSTSMQRNFGIQTDNIAITFRFLQGTITYFKAQMNDGTTSGPTFLTKAGSLMVIDGNGAEQVIQANYNAQQWYTIVLAANIDTNTYDVFVNGTLKAADVGFSNPLSKLNNAHFESGVTAIGNTFIDYVRVNNP